MPAFNLVFECALQMAFCMLAMAALLCSTMALLWCLMRLPRILFPETAPPASSSKELDTWLLALDSGCNEEQIRRVMAMTIASWIAYRTRNPKK